MYPNKAGLPSHSISEAIHPVKLITAHRVLITAGIAFFLLYALIQMRAYLTRGATDALVQAIVAAVVAVGLVFYYRTLKQWGRR